MIQPIIENSYLVEINLGTLAAQKQTNFNFIPQLEGSIIYGIQTFSASDITNSPNGSVVVSSAGLASINVTFAVGDNQDIFLMSCADLRSSNISGFVRMFANKKLNLTKSFITLNSVTNLNANESILFQFLYRKA
jgi:hypothetical protein